jgi:hypothetical protein
VFFAAKTLQGDDGHRLKLQGAQYELTLLGKPAVAPVPHLLLSL